MSYITYTFAERPDLADTADRLQGSIWPEFMLHDAVPNRLWGRMTGEFPHTQFMLLDENETILASGNSIPLAWDGDPASLPDDGFDWAFEHAIQGFDAGVTPNTLCAIAISILPAWQGKGLSSLMVQAMANIGRSLGFANLIAPVRPNRKQYYPLIPMDEYITWKNDAGDPFDAWLRVHVKLGGEILRACPQAMRIEGTLADWESWTAMRFPGSGDHIVPGALNPVHIDRAADRGWYVEPNVWTLHRLASAL